MQGRRARIDRDQARAAALSLLVHALAVLALIFWIDLDRPEPPPQDAYLVLDLGAPAAGEVTADAAADDAPAQPAPDPAVASDLPGRPLPGAPDPEALSGGDPALAEPAAGPTDATDEAATVPAPLPERAEAPPARPPASVVPAPSPRVAIAVPEIESPLLEARPLPDALPIPPVSADTSAGAVVIPGADPVLETPAQDLTAPLVAASFGDRRDVAQPDVRAAVAGDARPVDAPRPVASAPGPLALAAPDVAAASPSTGRDLAVAPAAPVRSARRLPTPSVQAAVRPVATDAAPGSAATTPDGDGLAGGDAASAGQENGSTDAPADALGRATDANGGAEGGARAAAPSPLRETRPRPIAVILDNAAGYPQSGLPQASWIAEMPVEGGLTRLMAFFDAGEPARVGPVRSARDYLVEVAGRADAVLVHDGGSPSALIALAQGIAPSLNAYTSGDLFERVADRSAPYDLYSAGPSLRDAIRVMRIDANRLLTGFRPVEPSAEAELASGVTLDWSGAYGSGFRYLPAQDRYRWIRNGDDAVSADGTAVQVEAVLIARIEARPIPGDTAGRLYVPVVGGDALLLWRGTVQQGSWSVEGGLRFTDAAGRRVSLEALTTWAAFVPASVEVELR